MKRTNTKYRKVGMSLGLKQELDKMEEKQEQGITTLLKSIFGGA